jgi:hypothetical protein
MRHIEEVNVLSFVCPWFHAVRCGSMPVQPAPSTRQLELWNQVVSVLRRMPPLIPEGAIDDTIHGAVRHAARTERKDQRLASPAPTRQTRSTASPATEHPLRFPLEVADTLHEDFKYSKRFEMRRCNCPMEAARVASAEEFKLCAH